MPEGRVRIVDIAEELGVSTATVSNVIHGKTAKISDETVKRVQQKLEERNYIPSMAGLLLAQNSSKIIGIIINNHGKYENRVLQDPFICECIDHLSEVLEKKGYFMMVKVTEKSEDIVQYASMWNMAGAIVMGFCEVDYEYLRSRMHIPFVVYDGYCDTIHRYANIIVDNETGGKLMGKYFVEKGYHRLLCISDNDSCMDHDRYQGFCDAVVESYGAERKPELLLIPMRKEERMDFYENNWKRILEFNGIFGVSDLYAIELMRFLKDKGTRIPEDIAIAGFDDIPFCEMVEPRLTTIRQDAGKRAEQAVELIEKLGIEEEGGEQYLLPVRLISRESA